MEDFFWHFIWSKLDFFHLDTELLCRPVCVDTKCHPRLWAQVFGGPCVVLLQSTSVFWRERSAGLSVIEIIYI